MCPTQVIVLILLIVILWAIMNPKKEHLTGPAVGNENYVRFYGDFNRKNKVFEMVASNSNTRSPEFFRYIWRGDVKEMDINLLADGPSGSSDTGPRRARVWAYRFYSPVGTTLTDFYNTYQTPEHTRQANPNLQLVADVKPGERFQTDDVPFSKRFLVELVL
jgi:hypothetical protein